VGGIGIEANGIYGFDRDISDVDENDEELVAVAGAAGSRRPATFARDASPRMAGPSLRRLGSAALESLGRARFRDAPGALVSVPGFKARRTSSGTAPYPIRLRHSRRHGGLRALGGYVLVDLRQRQLNRFPPRASADGAIAQRMRSRSSPRRSRRAARPRADSPSARIERRRDDSVVDRNGDILGLVRTDDAPVFGIDVSVQKARTALFFSHPMRPPSSPRAAGAALQLDVVPLGSTPRVPRFTGVGLDGSIAWTPRAIGNLHRPFYPDGIEGTPPGPLSTPYRALEPVQRRVPARPRLQPVRQGRPRRSRAGCAGRLPAGAVRSRRPRHCEAAQRRADLPGGVPIYRGDTLVGAIGVSGDGVDQDDMIAYLGVANAAARLRTASATRPPRARRYARPAGRAASLRAVPAVAVQRFERAECLPVAS
jgi:uncharacterized protein GlcG (DUF336 family)